MHLGLVVAVFMIGQTLESFFLTPWLVGDSIGSASGRRDLFDHGRWPVILVSSAYYLPLPVTAVVMVLLRYAHEQYTTSNLYGAERPMILTPGSEGSKRKHQCRDRCVSPQIPLTLKFSNDQGFDGFVGSRDSVSALQTIANGESKEWLYLSGAAGSGKSHLAAGDLCLGAEAGKARPVFSVDRVRRPSAGSFAGSGKCRHHLSRWLGTLCRPSGRRNSFVPFP